MWTTQSFLTSLQAMKMCSSPSRLRNCKTQAMQGCLGEEFAMVSDHITGNTSTQSICQTTHAHKDLLRDITSRNPKPDNLGLCNILRNFIRNDTQTAVTNITMKRNSLNLTFRMFRHTSLVVTVKKSDLNYLPRKPRQNFQNFYQAYLVNLVFTDVLTVIKYNSPLFCFVYSHTQYW